MKYLHFLILIFLLNINFSIAQQASDYFPQQTGFTWNYKLTPLDSLNNNVDSLIFFRADSFATVANYQGKQANIVLTKEGPAELINILPYTDSLFYHFLDTDAYEYLQVGRFELFLAALDSMLTDSVFSFLDMFHSFEDWYSMYRFNSAINQTYTLFSVDTTISINGDDIPLRFELNGKRLQDELLNTELGVFETKKFLIERGISFILIFPPPIPPVPVPIAFINDTVWIAQDNWIVKDVVPTTEIDLTLVGGNIIFLPGLQTEVVNNVTGIEDEFYTPEGIYLAQNYPNPFNPSTKIKFTIPFVETNRNSTLRTTLIVYDILGNEVAVLVNKDLSPGEYEVDFSAIGGSTFSRNALNLSSGIYFYQLKSGKFVITKKMILLK
jgi:Secretion system C-terminal sorting domain